MKASKTDNRFKTGFAKPITGLPKKPILTSLLSTLGPFTFIVLPMTVHYWVCTVLCTCMHVHYFVDKPWKPVNLRVTDVWKDYVTILWEEPENDGGSPVTGYTIEQRDAFEVGYRFVAAVDAKTTQFQVRFKKWLKHRCRLCI